MPKVLTQEQIDFYHEYGYLVPLDGVDRSEAAAMQADIERFQRGKDRAAGDLGFKGHLSYRRSYDFSFDDRILDVVEDLIGPNIMTFASRFWHKYGNDGTFVTWHQDSAYFGLEPHELVTVWLAVTDSTPEMGCMRVIPGTHRGKAFNHVETYEENNLLARGQAITEIDDNDGVDLVLKAGQFSCHHERIVHGSNANATANDRIGLSLFYIPTHVKSAIGRRSACLVRGSDEYGHWDPDPEPKAWMDPNVRDRIAAAARGYADPTLPQEAAG